MRKSLAVAIASVVFLAWWFCRDLNVRAQGGPTPCAHAKDGDGCLTPEQAQLLDELAFGKNVAGIYRLCNNFGHCALLTLSADGTAQYDQDDQFGHWPASTFHCTWKRIGDRTLRFRNTRLEFRNDGTPLNVGEAFAEGTFDDTFSVISGTWSAKGCSWDSWCAGGCDVLNQGSSGTFVATRIPIED